MKTLTIGVFGSILLLVLTAISTSAKPCECKDMDKLKAEILRTSTSEAAWKQIFGWTRGTTGRDVSPISNDALNTRFMQLARAPQSQWDRIMSEPIGKIETPQKAGELDKNGEPIVSDAYQQANCDEIIEGIRVHERAHRDFYLDPAKLVGGSALTWRLLSTRAESEVESYRRQTAYLREVLAKLESECHGELVYEAPITLNMQPLLMYKIVSNARISFKIDDNNKITGGGIQTLTLEQIGSGACTATSAGSEYEWTVSGQEENGFLQFKFSPKAGTTIPGIQMQCKIAGGQGYGMSLPVSFNIGDVRIEKKDGATRELDLSRVSGGRATGKAVTTLHLYKK